jgi:hypothetical protein
MALEPADLQRHWRAIAKLFPALTLPWDMLFDSSSYRMIAGVDFMQSIFHNSKSRKAAALLQELQADAIEPLSRLAEINVARTGELFKIVAICYISLPLGLTALLSDAVPEELRSFVLTNARNIGYVVFGLIFTPVMYFLGHWRAKQIAWTIDVFRAGGLVPAPSKTRRRA